MPHPLARGMVCCAGAILLGVAAQRATFAQYYSQTPPAASVSTSPVYVDPVITELGVEPVFVYPDAPHGPTMAPGYYEECPIEDGYAAAPSASRLPPGTRDGVFQKVNFTSLWMPNLGGEDGMGITQFKTDVVFGFPFLERETPLIITPEYGVQFIDGPSAIDVPPRLHDASVDFHHFRPVSDYWTFDAAVTVGAYADDHSFDSSEAVRVSGRAVGIYQSNPELQWIVGVMYVNRANATWLPAVGFIYATEDTRWEAIFPRPRYAWRTWSAGPPGVDERWWYVQGEFGGGIWAVERSSGTSDRLSYSDLRVLLGTERKQIGGLSRRWEVGYVFGREIEYASAPATFDLGDSLFVRSVLTY